MRATAADTNGYTCQNRRTIRSAALFGRKRLRRACSSLSAAALLAIATGSTPLQASELQTYTYDAQGRLIKVVRTGTVNNGATECYAYDNAGNRSNVTASTTSDCSISFSVNNPTVTEGGNLVFTITKTGTASGTTTVDYATADGTATAGSDYTAKSNTLTFLSTDTSKTVSVATTDDALVESAETMFLNLSNPTGGGTISDNQGVGTINDNDSTPTCGGVSFTISNGGAVTEGANSVFTVSKAGTASITCSVNYATANGTAVAPGDYTAQSGTLNFTSTTISLHVNVPTISDAVSESAETFSMALSSPTSPAMLGTPSSATATINDGPINHPPVAVDDNGGTLRTCGVKTYNVLSNDSDPDPGDTITLTAVSGSGGTYSIVSQQVQYQNDGTTGTQIATYTIKDSHGATDTATLTITVSGLCP